MRKLHKAAVVVTVLGSAGLLGASTAYAASEPGGGHDPNIQGGSCRSHDLNIDILGQVGFLNGLLGNALNGEGAPGAQISRLGAGMGCGPGI